MTLSTMAVGPGSADSGKATTAEESKEAIALLEAAIENIKDGITAETDEEKVNNNSNAIVKINEAKKIISTAS